MLFRSGGVLPPILFGVYIDELLMRLKRSGYGCHIGHIFTGALAYADDVVLIAPTMVSMRKLLDICSTFSKDSVKFNH